jgi:hypothetical protein
MRHGKIFGIYTEKGKDRKLIIFIIGKTIDKFPIRMRNCNKRGIWRYSIEDSSVTTDNGLHYTPIDMNRNRNDDKIREALEHFRSGRKEDQNKEL